MMDRDVMNLIQAGMAQANGGGGNFSSADLSRIDVCRIGHTAISRLRKLPADTKGRLWGVGMNELRKMVGPNGFRMPSPSQFGPSQINPGQFPSAQFSPGRITPGQLSMR
jgi:hypothetical protein